MRQKIPLIILGGSDRRPAALPPGGEGRHPLSGCKGVDIRLGGRCLVDLLIERLEASGGFGPIWIAGPEEIYRQAGTTVPVVDTDGGFGANIQAGIEAMVRHRPDAAQVAISTCDILPEVEELRKLLDDYWIGTPSDLWFPIVRTDPSQGLGASDWKPRYRMVPPGAKEAITILPGHLTIFDPSCLRLQFLYRLFDLAYRTRNRPLHYRRSFILRQVLGGLLRQDVLHILGLRLPTLTWDVVRHGVRAANRLRRGVVTVTEMEDAIRNMFVRRRHRRTYPNRRVRIPVTHSLSLAQDIDTIEEARAIGATASGT